jgi:nucleoside-diphosphate-sugar epimerase
VARQLVAQGHDVRALVRSRAAASALPHLSSVTLFEGDITDTSSMRDAMRGADGIFHLAAWYKVGAHDRSRADAINVGGTRNVLELMRELRVPRGVYTSTVAVFSDTRGRIVDERYRHNGPWLSEYDRTKWTAHYEVAEPMMREGLPLVIVQPGVVYGPADPSGIGGMFRDYLKRQLPAIPRGVAYSWAHVEDTARGHLLAMEKGRAGESYIIAGPAHSLIDAFGMAERITGVPAPRRRPHPAVLKVASRIAGVVERVTTLPGTFSAETLRVMAGVTYLGDPTKAKRELGFTTRPLEEGLRETLLYEQAQLSQLA